MGNLAKLIVSLGLDAADYKKGLKGADSATGSALGNIGNKLQGLGKKTAAIGAGLTAGVTTPILGLGLAAFNAASDLEESMSKVNVVFGDSADSVIAFSETAATNLGQSRQEALEAAGTFGNLFVSMKMAPDVAADMSKSLVTLGSDLASFNNTMPIEALEALRAGLTGETEPLKRYGINITAAAVAHKALHLGIVETNVDMLKAENARMAFIEAQHAAALAEQEFGASAHETTIALLEQEKAHREYEEALAGVPEDLTAAQKAQATYALIMEQTTTAQGDFQRTSDGAANSIRIAKAQLADAAAIMGDHLIPIGLKVVTFINDLISKFQTLSPETQKIILVVGGLAAAIGPLLMVAGPLISGLGTLLGLVGPIAGGLGAIAGVLSGPVIVAVGAVVGAVALLVTAWKKDWGGIRTKLTQVWNGTIKPALQKLWEWLNVKIIRACAKLKMWWENRLLPAIKKVWAFVQDNLIPLFQALWRLLSVTLSKALEALKGLWQNVLLPAIKAVWQFIQDKLVPIFKTVARVVEDTLGPILKWLKEKIIDPVASAFGGIGDAISGVIGWINDLITKIQNFQLPSWLQPGSPTPFEIGLWGINRALKAVARSGLPELEVAIGGVSRGGLPVGADGGMVAGVGSAGDRYVIYNQNAEAAALTMAEIEARRRSRLNAGMGG